MRLYSDVNAAVLDGNGVLPADCSIRSRVLENLEPQAPISQWSRGFVAGYQWLEETWGEYVPDEHDDEFGSLLMVLSFFSSRTFAEAVRDEMYAPEKSSVTVASTMRGLLPEAAAEFASLGRMIGAAVARAEGDG